MKPSHIEHIGIAVENLENSILQYEKLFGLKCYKIEEVKDQNVRTAFFKIGETKIELLESAGTHGPIARFIEKRGEGIHHIAFAVSDIESTIDDLQRAGAKLIDLKPKKGADGLEVAFIHPKEASGVLIEICGKSNRL